MPPSSLHISLGVQNISHTSKGEGHDRRWLRHSGSSDRRPHLRLQPSSLGRDLPDSLLVLRSVIRYALIDIVLQQRTNQHRIDGWEQVGANVLRTDCIGFLCFEDFAPVVTVESHLEGKPHDKAKKCQSSAENEFQIIPVAWLKIACVTEQ